MNRFEWSICFSILPPLAEREGSPLNTFVVLSSLACRLKNFSCSTKSCTGCQDCTTLKRRLWDLIIFPLNAHPVHVCVWGRAVTPVRWYFVPWVCAEGSSHPPSKAGHDCHRINRHALKTFVLRHQLHVSSLILLSKIKKKRGSFLKHQILLFINDSKLDRCFFFHFHLKGNNVYFFKFPFNYESECVHYL